MDQEIATKILSILLRVKGATLSRRCELRIRGTSTDTTKYHLDPADPPPPGALSVNLSVNGIPYHTHTTTSNIGGHYGIPQNDATVLIF